MAELRAVKHPPNRLERQLERLSDVPSFARIWYQGVVLRRAVPFTGTAGIDFLQMSRERVEVSLKNEKKVQNHIGGIHASAMNLLAETATGMVVGMNVRDDCLPLCKTLHIDFKRRAQGGLRAVARLSAAQRELMLKNDKGEVSVLVQVSDESGEQPIQCEFVWAWIPTPKSKDIAKNIAGQTTAA